MNEDEFELNGVVYVSADYKVSCRDCAFIRNREMCAKLKKVCSSNSRKDGRNVIFVEKRP